LLRHLEAVGFPHAPRVLGHDAAGREVLTYIPGDTNPDPRVSFASDDALAEVARLVRRYYDATTTFVLPPDAPWQVQIRAPTTGDVICHNDLAPWNTVVYDGHIRAFIDWDFAAPGRRMWDVAHAVWRFVPLYDDPGFGTHRDQARRARLFCDAYGVLADEELVDTILRRQRVLYDSIMVWAAAGEPAFMRMRDAGHAAMVKGDLTYLTRHRTALVRELRRINGR
jgi:hypothetical protein